MKYLIHIMVLLFITGCSSELDNQVYELVNAKNKWLEYSKQSDYSFLYERNCFCLLQGKKIHVLVQKEKIIFAKTEDGEIVDPQSIRTMIELFESILEHIKKQEWESSLSINVEYHPSFGYPTKINIKRPAIDGDVLISISNIVLQ